MSVTLLDDCLVRKIEKVAYSKWMMYNIVVFIN